MTYPSTTAHPLGRTSVVMAKTPPKPQSLPAPRAAKGRTLAEFLPLRRAEQVLLDACREGSVAIFNGGERPTEKPADEQDRLRSDFVRFLCLGGDAVNQVHEKGVKIKGGWIEPDEAGQGLDLTSSVLPRRITIVYTFIDGLVVLLEAKGSTINLVGSHVAGMICDAIKLTGGLFLRDGFQAIGAVRLLAARIDGDLVCSGSILQNATGVALYLDGAEIKGAFHFRKVSVIGQIGLSGTRVGSLLDDAEALQQGTDLILDGFRYAEIGDGPTDAATRIAWLRRQNPDYLTGDKFCPQPWTQLISVLRRMGHGAEADEVAIAFQDQRRAAGKVRGWLGRALHSMFGLLVGYGYKPLRLLKTMVAVWFVCGGIYWAAAMNGGFGPSNPLVFNHPDYKACTANERGNWYWCNPLPGEYTTFQPWLYSLDLILPLVELQQDKDWAPIIPTPLEYKKQKSPLSNVVEHALAVPDITLMQPMPPDGGRVPWFNWTAGQFARVVMWFEILFGWVASLLMVAVLTGLTNREKRDES
jgi:hypothetical protein